MEVKPGYKQSEVGVIPEDWNLHPLEGLAEILHGFGFQSRHFTDTGTYRLTTPGHFYEDGGFHDVGGKQRYYDGPLPHGCLLEKGDLLVAMTEQADGLLGSAAFVPIGGTFLHNQRLGKVRVLSLCLSKEFLYRVLNSSFYRSKVRETAAGTKVKHTSPARLLEIAVPLPPTRAEQEAIAEALTDVDALIESLDRLIAKKRDLKQAAMQQLLTGQTRLPGFHGEWESVEFGDIVSIRNAKVGASSTPAGIRCVELESIGQGSGRLLMPAEATGSSSKYSFRKGDVLFGRLRAYLRKYWLATFDGVCSTEIWPLVARDERLCRGFLHLLVQTNDFVNAAGVSYGTHMPRSDWQVLQKFHVRLPRVPEQAGIASVLSDMDAELSAREARRDKTRDLKQAMMQELLTGRTRLV